MNFFNGIQSEINSMNDHPCLSIEWDVIDEDHVLSSISDDGTLSMIFNSPGREKISLSLSIVITDHITNEIKYHKTKDCSILLVIYKAPYFAIDLGTTYSCIAYQKPNENPQTHLRDTEIVVMDSITREYCIPSAIYFPKNSSSIKIGNDALKMAETNNDRENLFYDLKRIIGRPSADPAMNEFVANHQFSVDLTERFPRIWIPNKNEFENAETILSAILYHLCARASHQFGVPNLKDVVISIPAIFHDSQRKAVYAAAGIAGLDVKQLVVEPSAAAMAYIYQQPSSATKEFSKYFMTLDVGGGTTDCSVLRCTGLYCEVIVVCLISIYYKFTFVGTVQVLGVAGNASLGGIDFDSVIVDLMMKHVLRQNPKWTEQKVLEMPLYGMLLSKAERVKHSLSVNSEHLIRVNGDNDYIQITVTREEFENHRQTKMLIKSIIDLVCCLCVRYESNEWCNDGV